MDGIPNGASVFDELAEALDQRDREIAAAAKWIEMHWRPRIEELRRKMMEGIRD